MPRPTIVVLMGVAGSGKTTLGELLSRELGWPFFDADAFHPPANVAKMAAGTPLTNEDRRPWLESLRRKIMEEMEAGQSAIFACSALKQSYRDFLRLSPDVRFVYLKGKASLIEQRLTDRRGHFMKPEMLSSQMKEMEEPDEALTVDVAHPPEKITAEIRRKLKPE